MKPDADGRWTGNAATVAAYRRRKAAEGGCRLEVMLEARQTAALDALRREGEPRGAAARRILVERLALSARPAGAQNAKSPADP